jgi:hypothetical protein
LLNQQVQGNCARAGLLLDDEGTLQALHHAVLDELLVEGGMLPVERLKNWNLTRMPTVMAMNSGATSLSSLLRIPV